MDFVRELTPQDPAQIGPYRILGLLGAGGMGRVYLARSAGGRTVAVKLVQGELAGHDEFRRRFAREVRAARQVGGAWTAPVLNADTESATPWVATGYVPGPSLHQAVNDHGALPARSVQVLAHGLAGALAAIHGTGLIHRDLKPGNVLVTIDGPRVIDFGIAHALDAGAGASGPALTATGSVIGSPGFMSPEQVRGQRLTPAADVFSLGSVLAFAATGRSPFGGVDSGAHALMFRIAEEEPDLDGLPRDLTGLVRDCLHKEPGRRPTPDELIRRTAPYAGSDGEPWLPAVVIAELGRRSAQLLELESAPTAPPVPAAPFMPPPTAPSVHALPTVTGPPRPPAPPVRPGRSRRPVTVVACAAAAVLAVGVALALSLKGSPGTGTDGGKQHADEAGSAASAEPSQRPATTPAPSKASPSTARQGALPPAYLGTWDGYAKDEYGEQLGYRRYTITQGEEGEVVARTLVSYEDSMCIGEASLVSYKNLVVWDVRNTVSVPEDHCPDVTEGQTMRAHGDGTLVWTDGQGEDSAVLHRAKPSERPVPAAFLGRWTFTEPKSGDVRTLTVSQAAYGEVAVAYTLDGDGTHCEWESRLATLDASRLRISPAVVTASEPKDSCDPSDSTRTLTLDGDDRLMMRDVAEDAQAQARTYRRSRD
ncbi:serine/threonine-protein kinase [Streptomyces sp. NPDC052225]|uniref:serine/threonine-protein kinase n=1 Tax=Streptomyces sp. NPDC052225 TaxID=3154949 RepID=UPI003448FC67